MFKYVYSKLLYIVILNYLTRSRQSAVFVILRTIREELPSGLNVIGHQNLTHNPNTPHLRRDGGLAGLGTPIPI